MWHNFEKLIDKNVTINKIMKMIDAIICLDQFSRHIYRSIKDKGKIQNNT